MASTKKYSKEFKIEAGRPHGEHAGRVRVLPITNIDRQAVNREQTGGISDSELNAIGTWNACNKARVGGGLP